jgi:hypothetical protein
LYLKVAQKGNSAVSNLHCKKTFHTSASRRLLSGNNWIIFRNITDRQREGIMRRRKEWK